MNPEDDEHRDALAAAADDLANLELLNTELAGRVARQEDANSKVDTKVAFLLGFIATATQFLASRHLQPELGVLAFTCYALAFALGIPALVIRPYQELNPRALYDGYADKTKTRTLLALCSLRVNIYEANDKKHEAKSAWWWCSLTATVAGLVFSVTAIVDAGTHDQLRRTAPAVASPVTATSPVTTLGGAGTRAGASLHGAAHLH
ncbi:hypothetical protein Caci_6923 [Catenulispora acidiphila DSM 44928]|uniref:Uncharacterized protein n=1 Tax=Catenulispora acidiphila (strain DSM 44928 / JCM 14897 / NBRC 102108 / NRRL B-24433 / ID139908) TaxID=479433 RepID=C7Q3J1_CATAD|nr:hypothetical protein [Catenulispora acidiphila]ACU75756.1 hypothetical protein Caci_6923 [Catenulispora acidiphila DSM 44928]